MCREILDHEYLKFGIPLELKRPQDGDFFLSFLFFFFETGFPCVALEPVLGLALVVQAGLKLTEICLPLHSKGWD